jgi:hypothetical protein
MIFHKEEIVAIHKFVHNPRLNILLIPFILFFACACIYQGDEFTFSAPFGFKTKLYEISEEVVPNNDPELLIHSSFGSLYFQVFRQNIPTESDLESVFNAHKTQSSGISSNYQFISQSMIEINDRTAIEYIYREFSGEPYWQRREVWMENNGRAYSLVCSDPADSTPGLTIPVSDLCLSLVEGFQFK